ncbi:MAG: DUF6353 family protein [Muribaculum sp.]|nr:DUF6353 family protein [Muribaculum sp.]
MKHVNFEKWKEPVDKLANVLTENSPTILTVFGCMGLVTTVGLAIKATINATKIVDEHKEEIDKMPQEHYKAAEAVRLTWKCYIPVVVAGGTSLGCIIGANSINLKRNAALVATYVATEDKLKGCENRILGTQVKKDQTDDSSTEEKTNKAFVVNGNKCMCKDGFSGRFFETSLSKVQDAQTALNRMITYELRVTVNELYDELGLDRIDAGDAYGWELEHGDEVDIDIEAIMDEQYGPVMLITYTPKHYWNWND